jgi:hypothetical protein
LKRFGQGAAGVALWIATISTALFALTVGAVAARMQGGGAIFGWILTCFPAIGFGFLCRSLYLRHRRLPYAPEPARGGHSYYPRLRFLAVSALSMPIFPVMVLSMMAGHHGFAGAVALFVAGVIFPVAIIYRILRQARLVHVPSQDPTGEITSDGAGGTIIFSRSDGEATFIAVAMGILMLALPALLAMAIVLAVSLFQTFYFGLLLLLFVTLFVAVAMPLIFTEQYRRVRDHPFPLLLIDDTGVRFRRAVEEQLPWSEIRSATVITGRLFANLIVKPAHPERFANRWRTPKTLVIGLATLKGPPQRVAQAIRDHHAYCGS